MQQLQQEDWIKQQLREKELYKQNYKEAHAAADAVAAHNCNMLQAAQEDHAAKRKAMQVACAEANRQLAKEKRDRDMKQAQDLQQYAYEEIDYTNNHDFMTENPATEQSMLAPHRVKPYHFKGLNAEQQQAILHERAQQVREKEMQKRCDQEEEKLWAQQ